jgi:membrane-associated phospholipid phosphatase
MKFGDSLTPNSGLAGQIGVRRANNRNLEGGPMQFIRERAPHVLVPLVTPAIVLLTISYPAYSQTESMLDPVSFHTASAQDAPVASEDTGAPGPPESRGSVRRGATRLLRDQKELYLAPFQRSNFKWDAMVLAGTGALLATDRRIERHLPGGNVDMYGNISDIALGGTSAALALAWGYGIKTHNEHLKETGRLEIEALVNTFLIYTPMQFAAGRQRPGEGNGYGDFGRHHNLDTSFPAGHAMFTIAMASVVAHEYPKPWVEALAYGAAASVMAGRLLGRDHWSSDVFVGSALGYFIGAHIFHSRCNPKFGGACHSHARGSLDP